MRTRPAWWYWLASAVLLGWGVLGVIACARQLSLGADAMPGASAYDRALFDGLPLWYRIDYAVATGAAVLGAIALLARSRHAVAILTVALLAVMLQFAWIFVATDIVAIKGTYVLYFPLLIVTIAALALHFANLARRRGWIG